MDLEPIWLSIKLAILTTFILLVIGIPIAYWLSRKNTIGRLIIEAFITMPLVLPPSVLGFYLLLAFSPNNSLGHWLQQHFNVQLVFSFEGLIQSAIYDQPYKICLFSASQILGGSILYYGKV
jgi:molybdate transport system permease protein